MSLFLSISDLPEETEFDILVDEILNAMDDDLLYDASGDIHSRAIRIAESEARKQLGIAD